MLSRMLSSRGFNVVVKDVSEKDLYGVLQRFKLLYAVSSDRRVVFTVRVRSDGYARLHLARQGLGGSDVERIVDGLESLGYTVSGDRELVTATLHTRIESLYSIAVKTIDYAVT